MSTEQSKDEQKELQPQPITAGPGLEFRIRHLAVALLLIGGAAWCARDGYYVYPREIEEARAKGQKLPHQDWLAIPFNRTAPFVLAPIGLYLAIRCLRLSRGRYHLEDDTLHVPGHPPIKLADIESLDMAKWDRKGIAEVTYMLDGQSATVTLDDFHYQQKPTDAIVEHIKQHLATDEEPVEQPSAE